MLEMMELKQVLKFLMVRIKCQLVPWQVSIKCYAWLRHVHFRTEALDFFFTEQCICSSEGCISTHI
jgi:hypothetical protein